MFKETFYLLFQEGLKVGFSRMDVLCGTNWPYLGFLCLVFEQSSVEVAWVALSGKDNKVPGPDSYSDVASWNTGDIFSSSRNHALLQNKSNVFKEYFCLKRN